MCKSDNGKNAVDCLFVSYAKHAYLKFEFPGPGALQFKCPAWLKVTGITRKRLKASTEVLVCPNGPKIRKHSG